MKKLIVHEITFDDENQWPDPKNYPNAGVFLVSFKNDYFMPTIVYNDSEFVYWFRQIHESCFERQIPTRGIVKNFEQVESPGMISEDFALQMLSVALHKQKV